LRGDSDRLEQPALGLEVERQLRGVGAALGVGVVVAMGGVGQDGSDGVGVFDDGDQTHPALAARTNERIVKSVPQKLGPGDADVARRGRRVGWGVVADSGAQAAQRQTGKRIVVGIGLLGDALGDSLALATSRGADAMEADEIPILSSAADQGGGGPL